MINLDDLFSEEGATVTEDQPGAVETPTEEKPVVKAEPEPPAEPGCPAERDRIWPSFSCVFWMPQACERLFQRLAEPPWPLGSGSMREAWTGIGRPWKGHSRLGESGTTFWPHRYHLFA